MRALGALLLKEWREALRTGKLIWLPAVFLLLGLIQPISARFMPDIIASAGNLPEGTIIDIPMPKPGEVMAQTLSQFGTIGLLAVCLAFMGTISGEKRSGTAAWILVKPVNPLAYVVSKWIVQSLIVGGSFGLGYAAAWYYTSALIGDPSTEGVAASVVLYGAWLAFIATVTLAASAFLKAPSTAAFSAFGAALALQLVYGLFESRLSWLPAGLNVAAVSRVNDGLAAGWIPSAAVTAAVIATLLWIAARKVSGAN
ncbi:ABC transporter permease [Cohnella boryungensis]|uniref:ABC transporter permease n=1 Tax=Cohnella boryungensis TaxID=768479 RepID=A0ABV8SBF7_9BACL